MEIQGTQDLKLKNERRARKAYIFVTFFVFLLVLRFWYLQIIQGKELRAFSDQNTIKEQKVQAPRGYILDRNGEILVGNRPGYRLSLQPNIMRRRNKKALKEILDQISPILKQDSSSLLEKAKKSYQALGTFTPTVISKEISQEEALDLKRLRVQYPEVLVEEVIFRDYPLKQSGAQILGYVSTASKKQIAKKRQKGLYLELGDQIGQTGLEKTLDNYVRGKNGLRYVQVDARGRAQNSSQDLIKRIGLKNIDAEIGNNVVLTLDKELQRKAFEVFFREDKVGIRKGGIVALNTKGEVLAWASNPSYDPSEFQTGISSDVWKNLNSNTYKPLTDKVAQGTYSPGSVFKPFVGLAALHFKAITPNKIVESPGYVYFGGRRYHDHKKQGHGNISLPTAIEVSANTFFYKLGMALGVDQMSQVISEFGLGSKTGLEFVQESKGLLPNSEWKLKNRKEAWQRGEDLSYAIGQGFILTTLLQLAKGYLVFATKGKVYNPSLVKEIISSEGESVKSFSKKDFKDLTSPESLGIKKKHFKTIIDGLKKVTHGERGTARYRSSRYFKMAGKTGTVQVKSFGSDEIYNKCEEQEEEDRHHGLFVGFAPADKPEIVVAALALHACHGSSGAAPMVTELLESYMKSKYPDLFKRKQNAN